MKNFVGKVAACLLVGIFAMGVNMPKKVMKPAVKAETKKAVETFSGVVTDVDADKGLLKVKDEAGSVKAFVMPKEASVKSGTTKMATEGIKVGDKVTVSSVKEGDALTVKSVKIAKEKKAAAKAKAKAKGQAAKDKAKKAVGE